MVAGMWKNSKAVQRRKYGTDPKAFAKSKGKTCESPPFLQLGYDAKSWLCIWRIPDWWVNLVFPLQISCFYAIMLRRPPFHLPLRNSSMFATSFSFGINKPPALCHVLVYFYHTAAQEEQLWKLTIHFGSFKHTSSAPLICLLYACEVGSKILHNIATCKWHINCMTQTNNEICWHLLVILTSIYTLLHTLKLLTVEFWRFYWFIHATLHLSQEICNKLSFQLSCCLFPVYPTCCRLYDSLVFSDNSSISSHQTLYKYCTHELHTAHINSLTLSCTSALQLNDCFLP